MTSTTTACDSTDALNPDCVGTGSFTTRIDTTPADDHRSAAPGRERLRLEQGQRHRRLHVRRSPWSPGSRQCVAAPTSSPTRRRARRLTGTATDNTGHAATRPPTVVKIDKTAPTIAGRGPDAGQERQRLEQHERHGDLHLHRPGHVRVGGRHLGVRPGRHPDPRPGRRGLRDRRLVSRPDGHHRGREPAGDAQRQRQGREHLGQRDGHRDQHRQDRPGDHHHAADRDLRSPPGRAVGATTAATRSRESRPARARARLRRSDRQRRRARHHAPAAPTRRSRSTQSTRPATPRPSRSPTRSGPRRPSSSPRPTA